MMQVPGWLDMEMVGCRSSDGTMQVPIAIVQILETDTLLGKVGALL